MIDYGEVLKYGGPATALIAGALYIIYTQQVRHQGTVEKLIDSANKSQKEFIESIKEYPKQLQAIGHECHDTTKQLQANFQTQLDSMNQDQKLIVREIITAVNDNSKALTDLRKEIRSYHK